MDQLTWITDYGLWGLGVAAFLGATLVPVSSEVAVVAALKMGLPPWQVFISASIGNALGASLNYILGWLFSGRIEERLQAGKAGRKALRWTQKYGKWSLPGSWLPTVGDPLCLAAGLFRLDFLFFEQVGIGTRVPRYRFILQIF